MFRVCCGILHGLLQPLYYSLPVRLRMYAVKRLHSYGGKVRIILVVLIVFVTVSCNYGTKQESVSSTRGDTIASSSSPDQSKSTSRFDILGKKELHTDRNPAVCDYAKYYPCDATLQSEYWVTMTVEERMLAKGYEFVQDDGSSYNPKREVNPVRNLVGMIACYYNKYGKMPESTDDIWTCAAELIETQGTLDKPISQIKKEFYDSLVSPVTGSLIAWDKQSFSRGNAFITVMNNNPDAITEAEVRYANLSDMLPEKPANAPFPANATGKTIHMMARVYGETGILDSFVTVYKF